MSIKTITQKIKNPFYDSENPDSNKWIDLIEIKEPWTTPVFKGESEKYNLESSDLTNLVDGAAIQESAVDTKAIKKGAVTAEKLGIKASVEIDRPSIYIEENSLIINSSIKNDKEIIISNNSGG